MIIPQIRTPKPPVPKWANYDYLPVWSGDIHVGWIMVETVIEKNPNYKGDA